MKPRSRRRPARRRRWRAGRQLRRVLANPLARVVAAVVGAALLATILYALADSRSRRLPEVHPPDAAATSPFALPFTIRNTSAIFDLHAVEVFCLVHSIAFKDGVVLGNIELGTVLSNETILSGSSGLYRCDASRLSRQGVSIERLHLTFVVRYTLNLIAFDWQRRYVSLPFWWVPSPSGHAAWIEAETLR